MNLCTTLIVQLDGLVSLHFVDFRDLTWRTTIHPTNLNAKIETQKTKEVSLHGGIGCLGGMVSCACVS